MGRRWFVSAATVFATLLVVWGAAAFFLSTASAQELPLSMRLDSLLDADYSAESSGGSILGAFKLSIVGDVLRDEGRSSEEASDQSDLVKLALESPIPTATALNFQGEAPYTATPSKTPVLTKTAEPTKTPKPTSTPKPTEKPTTNPDGDYKAPIIHGYEERSPDGDGLGSCDGVIHVYGLKVEDKAYSEGLKWVRLKYQDPVSGEWTYGSSLYPSPPSGWELGDRWVGYYDLSIEVDISPDCGGAKFSFAGFNESIKLTCNNSFTVKAWVKDNAGHESYKVIATYEVPEYCVEEPEPTEEPTDEPTDEPPDEPTD